MQILLHVSDALFNWQESVNSSHQVFFIWLMGLVALLMFQEPDAELFDRSGAIIHWKISHAVPVRVKFQILSVPHLLESALS